MPKLKTHKGMSKVFKKNAKGNIKKYSPGMRHNTGHKNAAANRNGRKATALSKTDYKRIKELI